MQSQHNPITILFILLKHVGTMEVVWNADTGTRFYTVLLLVSIQLRHCLATSHVESIFDDR
jgi:hypothetical protein